MPRTELASASGLMVGNGITVEACLRISDPDIYAMGDCASFPNTRSGTHTRLESVQNATDQARHAARAMLGTDCGGYADLRWFWSNRGPLRLQIAGLVAPGDDVVLRGDPASEKFFVFCFRDVVLAAVESVNQPADHMAARRLLAAGRSLKPEQADNPDFDFKEYSKQQPAAV